MIRRRSVGFLLMGLLAVAAWSGPVRAAEPQAAFAIGSSLGVSHLIPEQGDGITVIAIPNGSTLFSVAPGFRAATVSAGRGFEFGIDLAVLYVNASGSSIHEVAVGLDAMGFLSTSGATSPYLGVQGGMTNVDFFTSVTQPYLGADFGVRHIVGTDHGAAKFGVGVRRFFENQSDGQPAFTAIDFKIAFDLWVTN